VASEGHAGFYAFQAQRLIGRKRLFERRKSKWENNIKINL
jgi:hypothetical protein